MPPSPRILLSIDYEPWFALTRRYDSLTGLEQRRTLDGDFSKNAIDPILEMLGPNKASFYIVGELTDWYPELPQKIVASGHELGMHCQLHRLLMDPAELEKDIIASQAWRKLYNVRGYRAPMVGIREAAYPLLARAGFQYSSSIYAPAGTLLQKGGVWELPVSSLPTLRSPQNLQAPRQISLQMLFNGEIPYGSALMIGLLNNGIFPILERELKAGRSPVIILHPYELVRPEAFLRRLLPDVASHPALFPFTLNKSGFLKKLLQTFPVSPLGTYLDEAIAHQETAHV